MGFPKMLQTFIFFLFVSEAKPSCGHQGDHQKEFGQVAESPRKRN
jgi:hypothetical protein